MRAPNPRRPLCEREGHVGLGGKGKRARQNQTDMIQLRRSGLQSVKIRRRGGYLTARMGFRHSPVATLSRHLLAARHLSSRHLLIWQARECWDRQPHSHARAAQVAGRRKLHDDDRRDSRDPGGSGYDMGEAEGGVLGLCCYPRSNVTRREIP